MHAIRLTITGLLILAASAPAALAQSDDETPVQIWLDVNPAYYRNPQQKFYGDAGVRWETTHDGWWRLVVRPSFRTRISGRFYFATGVGNFYTFNPTIANRYELRPFQGLDFNWPRGTVPLHHYFRLEERFDFNTDTWVSKNSLRGRYKISASYKWGSTRHENRFWKATAGAELFATFAGEQGQFQEQSRVTLGVDRSLSHELHFRLEATWQRETGFFHPDESVSNIYFRFRMTRSWGHQKA